MRRAFLVFTLPCMGRITCELNAHFKAHRAFKCVWNMTSTQDKTFHVVMESVEEYAQACGIDEARETLRS